MSENLLVNKTYNYTLIIPHYNISSLLGRLLKTVPQREDMQVIVVDDCSTKDLNKLEQLREEYPWIEWYDTGTNGGGGKARNIGLDHAKGKYVLFADADDFFLPNLNLVLDNHKDENFDICYLGVIALHENSFNFWGDLNYNKILKKFKNAEDFRYKIPSPWSKLYNLDMIIKYNIKFSETIIANDIYFTTLCDYYSKKIEIDKHTIYVYVVSDNSTSHVYTVEKELIRLEERLKCDKFLFDHNQIKLLIKKSSRGIGAILKNATSIQIQELYNLGEKYNISKLEIQLSGNIFNILYNIKHLGR
ncbi:MAG: glycosyltransferase family 2 protein [Muribaculaceae bacterium]|nr:glycosyltransferase family 2 protein [Muribaculaceae bacterium]